jgi:hypothetical protein
MIQTDHSFKIIISQLNSAQDSISAFFDSGLPNEHRKDLKKWRHFVINDEQYNGRHGAAHVFTQYEENVQLIEAAHTFLNYQQALSDCVNVNEGDIIREKTEWDYFPTNLSKKLLLNPFLVIEKFFKNITIEQYKDLLNEWLRIALSNKAAGETLTPKDVIVVYDNLRILYAATWLIHQRQITFRINLDNQ